ncbi:MAG: DUF177 domain-containing protein [Candidatus Eremiobacteraeota bacterium]|nr:DUF177 domain-containing protein [Candidatus Eremiobacteraeota bacterium]
MGSSLVIDIGSVLFAGRPVSLDERVEVSPFSEFTFPQPAHVRLDLRRVERGLDVSGTIELAAEGPCGRCLEDVVVPMTVEVEERFDPLGGTSDPFGENNVLSGTDLDVADLVRQLVTSAMPLTLTCREDCRGLCATCGWSKNAGGGCTCPTEGDHGESEMENPPVQDA